MNPCVALPGRWRLSRFTIDHHLPLLLQAAGAIGADWDAWHSRPLEIIGGAS